jgi:hypothetical protein
MVYLTKILFFVNCFLFVSAVRDSVANVSPLRDRVTVSLAESSSLKQKIACPGQSINNNNHVLNLKCMFKQLWLLIVNYTYN